MAFYSKLSRASSSVLPLAIHTVPSSRTFHKAAFNFLSTEKRNLSSELTRRSRVPIMQFSTETEAPKPSGDENQICVVESKIQCNQSADENLISVLESKIQCTKESDDRNSVQEITDVFPFKIQRNKNSSVVLLTREWQDENIVVKGYISDDEDSDEDEAEENDEDENSDEEDEKEEKEARFDLDVIVSKKSGLKLIFDVVASQKRIFIDCLSMKQLQPDGSEVVVAYEGPRSSRLVGQMKKAFRKYLEVRGIKPSIINFLPKCKAKKNSKERLEWLNNIKNFIKH